MEYPIEYLRHRERIRAWLLGKEFFDAVKALEFAALYHTGIRKDGITPEFHHQISIAHYLRTLPNIRNPEKVFVTAFLHDLVEDYSISPEIIREMFGDAVAMAVLLMSKKYMSDVKDKKEYYAAMRGNPIASLCKGADRIHNFQTMPTVFSCEKQLRYISECEEHILPMLAAARNNFPDQELAYENIKHALKGQIELIKLVIEARLENNE